MPDTRSLDDWLDYISGQHPKTMELGLDRVATVARRLAVDRPAPQVVTIAGTNGKGSTTIALESLLLGAEVSVGATLSPHVSRFNERIRLNGEEAGDEAICAAFRQVDELRGEIPLTYFEYAALAALWLIREADVDVAILEIGLGGRLDAFNVVDADVAIITSIGLDHADYLGSDLEGIGREKAGIFRNDQQVVLGAVTESVHAAAHALNCSTFTLGREMTVKRLDESWDYECTSRSQRFRKITVGGLAPDNCALALTAASLVLERLDRSVPLDPGVLTRAFLPGRLECHTYADTAVILDVAHNPAAARFLARELDFRWPDRCFVALYGSLADKDASGVVAALGDRVSHWLLIPTQGWRAQSAQALADRLISSGATTEVYDNVPTALDRAVSLSGSGNGILAFGSFSAVEQVRELLIVPPSAGH